MSGITGIFYRNGQNVDPELIKKMNAKLSHRGPNGSAVWIEGSIALGHQMLHTTQESLKESLPFHDEKTDLVITADARIDNRQELSKKLNIEDTDDIADSYFILKSYEKWGDKCPEYLLGDFAFVIWDVNEKKLFCARDHMGVRPFYYYVSDDIFVFASEIKALFSIPEIPHNSNEWRIALHLIPLYNDRKITFYKKILRLPAANTILVNNKEIIIKKYWELKNDLEIKLNSDEEYVKKFLEIFTECINCRLRTSFPVGFELSGGLDSSSIVCTAKKILNEKNQSSYIKTFSKTYENTPESDERTFIKEIVNLGGIKPFFFNADNIPLLSQMDEIFSFYDEPFDVPILAHNWSFYKKIRENEIKILFRGLGGDTTIFYGTNYLKELAMTFQWIKLYKETKCSSKRLNRTHFSVMFGVIFSLLPNSLKKIVGTIKNKEERSNYSLINKELIEKYNLKDNINILHPSAIEKNSKKTHYHFLSSEAHQYYLEASNIISTAFNIELAYPYYDKRLIEFCYAIPSEQKFRDGLGRMILRRAMKDILPEKIRLRPSKVDFNQVIENDFLMFKEKYIDILKNELLKDFVDLEYLNNLSKKESNFEIYDMTDIMRLIMIKLWIEKKN